MGLEMQNGLHNLVRRDGRGPGRLAGFAGGYLPSEQAFVGDAKAVMQPLDHPQA